MSHAPPRGLVSGVAGAGGLALDPGADRRAAAGRKKRIREPSLVIGLLSRDREVVRVEGALDHDGWARRPRVRGCAVEAGKREVRILLDSHVDSDRAEVTGATILPRTADECGTRVLQALPIVPVPISAHCVSAGAEAHPNRGLPNRAAGYGTRSGFTTWNRITSAR